MDRFSRRQALAALGVLATESCRTASQEGPTSLDLPKNPKADALSAIPLSDVHLAGRLGRAVDLCIRNRVFAQDTAKLVEPFRRRNERTCWQTEFWGKWFLSAAAACEYTGDPAWRERLHASTHELLSTQSADGYIGNYAEGSRLKGWDVWGRKYTLLGLLASYRMDGDPATLTGARRLADGLMAEVGPGKADIVKLGFYRGMPASSVLQPIMQLYVATGDDRYLRFAEYIVARWGSPGGPELVKKALEDIPVGQRFPPPAKWWSWENGEKAYEMMSCYAGLIELYRATGWSRALEAAVKSCESIRDTEINVAGSGSAMECWYGGRAHQTETPERPMETCVSVTWMQLCANLLRATGDSQYGDEIERTAYNALLGAMRPDGSWFAQYSALAGARTTGELQCGMGLNCCVANGPRGIMLLPEVAVMIGADGPYVNLYSDGVWNLKLPSGARCRLEMKTDYPLSGDVELHVNPEQPSSFPLLLRIPWWSDQTTATVNGAPVSGVQHGGWAAIARRWGSGDRISLHLDMRGRVLTQQQHVAVARGPIALARDVRLGGNIDAPVTTGQMELHPMSPPEGIAMAFAAADNTVLCDYASAGNTWDARSRYRTWMPA